MAPVLIFTYYRLARNEEKELVLKFGEQYLLYRRRVPMFFPEFIPSRGIRVSKDTLS
jgi:protein-S-isoprenylcysteine O-methyltransferase Ste14